MHKMRRKTRLCDIDNSIPFNLYSEYMFEEILHNNDDDE